MTSKQAQRVRARAMGLCAVCCSRPANVGFKTCQHCLDRNRLYYRRLYAMAKQARDTEARQFEWQDLITVGVWVGFLALLLVGMLLHIWGWY